MKKSSRILSLFLAVLMLVSVMAVPASAESSGDPQYKQCRSMLTIGTSMIRGYDIPYWDDYNMETVHGFEGNTPYYVGQAVGAELENSYLAAIAGATVSMPLWLLGLIEPTDDYLYNVNAHHHDVRYGQRLYPFFGADIGGQGFSFSEIIKTTDLIVIELGLGDTVFRAKELALPVLDSGSVAEAVEVLVSQLFEGFAYFESRLPMLLDYIKENSDAEVVLVGSANVTDSLPLTDADFLPVGNALEIIFASLNAFIEEQAKEYGFKYADISGMEMRCTADDLSITNEEFLSRLDYYLHPSDEGIQFMARKILEQLRVEPLSNNIHIDLGPVKSVQTVLVDTKSVSDYSFDPATHTITLPSRLNNAKSIMVTSVGDDGKVYLATYVIEHDADGYTAHKIFSTVNAGRALSNVISNIVSLIKTVANTFMALLGK